MAAPCVGQYLRKWLSAGTHELIEDLQDRAQNNDRHQQNASLVQQPKERSYVHRNNKTMSCIIVLYTTNGEKCPCLFVVITCVEKASYT